MIVEMLRIIESTNDLSYDDATMEIYECYSTFDGVFMELKMIDIEIAHQSLQHWMNYLRGPDRKPTIDYIGVLRFTVSLIEGA